MCIRDSKSFSGEGRARRKEYWSFTLFFILLCTVPTITMGHAMASYSYDYGYSDGSLVGALEAWFFFYGYYDSGLVGALGAWFLVLVVVSLIFLPAAITVMIRRLHDIGLSGWLVLLGLAAYFLVLLGLVPPAFVSFFGALGGIPSQAQVNKHGPIPKPRP